MFKIGSREKDLLLVFFKQQDNKYIFYSSQLMNRYLSVLVWIIVLIFYKPDILEPNVVQLHKDKARQEMYGTALKDIEEKEDSAKLKQLPDDVTGSKKSSKLALPVIEETGEHRDAASELDDITFIVPLPKAKPIKKFDPGKGIFVKKDVEDIYAKSTAKLEKEDYCFEDLQVMKEEHRKD